MPDPVSRTQAVAFGATVCALLAFAHSAVAGTTLRDARDISGVWQSYPETLGFDATVKPGDPQRVILQPEYDASYKASLASKAKNEAAGKPVVDDLTLCMPGGMPAAMQALFPMEIVVAKRVVYVIIEGVDPMRRIYLDGRPMPRGDDLTPTFEGYSVGKWEGNTLVVDTAGVKSRTKIEGVPHSDALRINERIRLLDDDTLEDVFTITDPKAFKVPWVITKHYKDYNTVTTADSPGVKGIDPGKYPNHGEAALEASEFVCNENNRNLPGDNGVVGFDTK
ncbi:MAG: hypothetical protein WA825_07415 [Steroidobacteraceae bacterium]